LLGCSSKDGTVRLWDARTWEEITTLHHDNPVLGIDFSPDGHTLAAAVAYDNDCQLKVPERVGVDLWDLNNNAKSIRLPLEVEPASGVVFSNDGEYVAIGCIDGTVVIWDVTKEKKRLTLKGHGSEVLSVAFSPDGKMRSWWPSRVACVSPVATAHSLAE